MKKTYYGVAEPMIKFVERKINIGTENILTVIGEKLISLAEKGLIEKREIGGGKIYYYVETEADDIRFGVFIREVARERS